MGQQMSGPDNSNGKSIRHELEGWGSSSPKVKTFSVSKTWHFHKNIMHIIYYQHFQHFNNGTLNASKGIIAA